MLCPHLAFSLEGMTREAASCFNDLTAETVTRQRVGVLPILCFLFFLHII